MRRLALLAALALLPGCPEPEPPGTSPNTAVCGNGVHESNEWCDDGAANGPDANCLADCTLNPIQSFDAGEDVIDEANIDAVSSSDGGALGEGAWCASGVDSNGDGLIKFELYYDPEFDDLDPEWGVDSNLGPITVADIAEVAYWTRRADLTAVADFYLVVYTRPEDGDSGWYRSRLLAEPYLARHDGEPGDGWERWSTAPGGHLLTFTDPDRTGSWYTQPSLGELVATSDFDWSEYDGGLDATSLDYGSERVLYLSLQTASGNPDFAGCVDALEITLTDGRGFRLDLG